MADTTDPRRRLLPDDDLARDPTLDKHSVRNPHPQPRARLENYPLPRAALAALPDGAGSAHHRPPRLPPTPAYLAENGCAFVPRVTACLRLLRPSSRTYWPNAPSRVRPNEKVHRRGA